MPAAFPVVPGRHGGFGNVMPIDVTDEANKKQSTREVDARSLLGDSSSRRGLIFSQKWREERQVVRADPDPSDVCQRSPWRVGSTAPQVWRMSVRLTSSPLHNLHKPNRISMGCTRDPPSPPPQAHFYIYLFFFSYFDLEAYDDWSVLVCLPRKSEVDS